MTETDLNTLVHDHVARSEPPFLLQPEGAITQGRRTVRRRRALGAGVAALAIALVATVPQLVDGHSDSRTGIDPTTQHALDDYDAQQMPAKMRAAVDAVLQASGTDLGAGTFTAGDDQENPLPAKYYDKASGMSVTYGGATDHRFTLSLQHSAGEAEGGAERNCRNDLAGGLYFSCVVTTTPEGAVVTTRVMALRREPGRMGWGVLTPDELRTGTPSATDPVQGPIDRNDVWFAREVKSVHSKTFVSDAEEYVRAPDLAAAKQLWTVPVSGLVNLATDPALVIPKPPTQSNGCAWSLHPEQIGCDVPAPAGAGTD